MITVNNETVLETLFPDKTSQVWQLECIKEKPKKFSIEWKYENESEIMHLAQLMTLIRHARVPCPIYLYMPYLPYARQDKDISNESAFALHSFANIINSMGFDRIEFLDVHSNKALQLIKNSVNLTPEMCILDTLGCTNSDTIAYPDAGAKSRYSIYKNIFKVNNFVTGTKNRNPLTGLIDGYFLEGNVKGKNVLMVDDICDGGMTFKLMAKDLYKNGAKNVNLYVTHGIFSKGLGTLKLSNIKRIFTHEGEIL